MGEEFLAYVAGIFDGEGSIGVYEYARGGFVFRVQMTQNVTKDSEKLWHLFAGYWGGAVSYQETLSGNTKMNWQLGQKQGIKFLTDIKPYLRLKAEQAAIALDWISKNSRERDSQGRFKPRTETEIEEGRAVVKLLKELKGVK